jgi:hypothetical protein
MRRGLAREKEWRGGRMGDRRGFERGAQVLTVGVIRITPAILEFCPDLSQRVNPDK